MSVQNRSTLKSFFRKGQMPSEAHFNDLIESMINKVDDGMSKTIDDGLTLSPIGVSNKLISFYKSIEDKNPAWSIEVDSGTSNLNFNDHKGDSVLTLNNQGKVGIKQSQPEYELDVNGVAAMAGRIGTFDQGKIPADGKWHAVMEGLDGCNAFEILAGVGKRKTGKYALLHATALSTYGKSKPKIRKTQAFYGVRCNKIQIRWRGTTYDYKLMMRTKCSYGSDHYVRFYITNLWFDNLMDGSVGEFGTDGESKYTLRQRVESLEQKLGNNGEETP